MSRDIENSPRTSKAVDSCCTAKKPTAKSSPTYPGRVYENVIRRTFAQYRIAFFSVAEPGAAFTVSKRLVDLIGLCVERCAARRLQSNFLFEKLLSLLII